MRIVPRDHGPQIVFFQTRAVGAWAAHADPIGSSPAEVAALAALVDQARAARLAQDRARLAARSATQAYRAAMAAMADAGGAIIRKVKDRAATTAGQPDGGDAIYTLAALPVPSRPSTLPPPGTPTGFTVAVDALGALTLPWACRNPRGATGTIYQVSRRLDGAGGGGRFEVIGVAGTRRFTDETCPAGAGVVTYRVVAMRSTAQGNAGQFTVNLGVSGPGLNAPRTFQPRAA